jgi:hypothetical protein
MQKSHLLRALCVPVLCLSSVMAQTSSQPAPKKEGRTARTIDLALGDFNHMVIEGRDTKVAPLSVGQKFGQVGKNFFNPFTFVGVGVEAGVDQALDIHHKYGQGAQGYGKRYGADLADVATAQFFGIGFYPSIFHTDPRYYRAGKGSFIPRTWYAATRVLVTRTDSGRRIFNTPEILGAATSSGISRAYYPSDERNAGDFAYSMGSRIAFDAAYNIAKEFWPDVRRHMFGGH